jgi:patatin-like phospholipase/acyl hydrolase
MRGLIPSLVLQNLRDRLLRSGIEEDFPRLFDLMAGTSTGGLVALALSMPEADSNRPGGFLRSPALTIEDVVELYTQAGRVLFPRSVFHKIRKLEQAFREKYSNGPVQDLFEDTFGEVTLKNSLCHLLIPSYDVEAGTGFLFKHRPCRKERTRSDPDYLLRDVALATTAAPTYFEPAEVKPVDGGETRFLLDGGLYANNPSMCAYIEARKTFPRARKFFILSLGTGNRQYGISHHQMRKWGYLDWVSPVRGVPLFRTMAGAQAECVEYQLSKIPGVTYVRLDGVLDEPCEMDDASRRAMQVLKRTAGDIIAGKSDTLDRVCAMLKPGPLSRVKRCFRV